MEQGMWNTAIGRLAKTFILDGRRKFPLARWALAAGQSSEPATVKHDKRLVAIFWYGPHNRRKRRERGVQWTLKLINA
jgi:hypothetical protein